MPPTRPDGSPWPRISIVTPSYNQGQFIEETIRSVLLQGYPDLEYIIMDGGSTDDSVEIIRKYKQWLKYWQSTPDNGFATALNSGFQHTTGQIVAWINSDDGYLPEAFEAVSNSIASPTKCFIFGNYHVRSRNQVALVRTGPVRKIYSFVGGMVPQHSAFWTKDIHLDLDQKIHAWIDYELWIRVLPLAKRIVRVNKYIAFVNIHENQKTNISIRNGQGQQDDVYILEKHHMIRTSLRWKIPRYLYLFERRMSETLTMLRSDD